VRLVPVLLAALGACVPDLGRVFPDVGVAADTYPSWPSNDLPTHISVGDQGSADTPAAHGKPEVSVLDAQARDQQPLDQRPPDQVQGSWHQANQQNCPTFCAGLGQTNVPGPEGAHCMSGEVRSASGVTAGIQFTWGCFKTCAPMGAHQAESVGTNCYMPGQKNDNDATDRTVGCFCR